MNYRELKNKVVDCGITVDNIPVMFRTPTCSAYIGAECHIAKVAGIDTLMIDLVNDITISSKDAANSYIAPKHGSDFDFDSSRPPVEDDINADIAIVPKDSAKSYIADCTDQDLYIADLMNSILKAMSSNGTNLSFFVDRSVIEPFTLGCLFRKNGYEVDIVIEDNCEAKMTVKW